MSLPDGLYLDHIAIAVNSIDDRIKIYEDIGFSFESKREIVEEQKVKTAFAMIDKHAHIELLESTSSEGPIGKYIAKNGEGIHHICFRVDDIKTKTKQMSEQGYRFIYEAPRKGAGGCLVNFIHPKSSGGVLIELSQKEAL